MARRFTAALLTLLVATSVARTSDAGVIFHESFEAGPGLAPGGYAVTGGGSQGNAFWSVLPTDNLNLGFGPSGIDGASYFGGRRLDGNFGGDAGSGAVRQVTFSPIDVSRSVDATMSIALAARPGRKRFSAGDFLRLSASFDGGVFVLIDEFLAPPSGKGKLTNADSVALGAQLSVLEYDIPNALTLSASSLVIRVEALASGGSAAVAFDDLVVSNQTIPEPASLGLLGAALLALGLGPAVGRRRRMTVPELP